MYVIKATAKITGSENYMRQFTVKTPGVPYTPAEYGTKWAKKFARKGNAENYIKRWGSGYYTHEIIEIEEG